MFCCGSSLAGLSVFRLSFPLTGMVYPYSWPCLNSECLDTLTAAKVVSTVQGSRTIQLIICKTLSTMSSGKYQWGHRHSPKGHQAPILLQPSSPGRQHCFAACPVCMCSISRLQKAPHTVQGWSLTHMTPDTGMWGMKWE
ncbi:hypothetical protein V8E53_000334 [Lactarius tabidus]